MRSVNFEKIMNFRNLGGYECTYGETAFGVLYRSGRLFGASVSDINKLYSLGLKTIIDIRDDEAKCLCPDPELNGVKTISLPVNGNGRIPINQEDQINSYLEMLEEPKMARDIFLALLNSEKPALIHCNAGKDRTGVFVFLLLLLNGVSFNDVNADYMASFAYLLELERLVKCGQSDIPPFIIGPDQFFLEKVYAAFLDRYGSIESYLEAIGLSEDEINGLANLLGKQEKSCGAVLFKDGKVLVEHMTMGHYSIPKGHVEPCDANEEATALREIKEELGLGASIIPGFRERIVYSPRKGSIKEVVFYCAQAKEGKIKLQKEEVDDAYWLSPADAMRVLSHDSDRHVVAKASYFEAGPNVKKVS